MTPKSLNPSPVYFHIQSICMGIFGAYLDKVKNAGWNRIRRSFCCSLSFCILIALAYGIRHSEENKQALCHLLGLVVGMFLSCIKVRTLDVQVNDFVDLNIQLNNLSASIVLPEDRKLLTRANKLGQTVSLINIISILMSTVMLILYPLAEPIYHFFVLEDRHSIVWPTPFDLKLPFDVSYSPVYELVYTLIFYNFLMCCVCINVTDSMFVEAALLIASHFKILRRNIEELECDHLDEGLRMVFVYHLRILAAKDALQRTYSVIMPFFVIVSTTMFGLFVISALQASGLTVFKSLGYSVSALLQIYFYTYGGNVIFDSSDGIVNSYYHTNWYEGLPKQRKDIISVMIMVQNGIRIYAGMVELSLNTFGRILSSTVSLVIALRSVFG